MSDEDRTSRPFDAGLQPERTALAWRRTALAIAVGSLAGARVLSHVFGAWALLPAGLGLALAVGIMVVVHRRHLEVHRRLTTSATDRIPLHGGGLPAVVALAVLVAGVLGLTVALA